MGVLVYFGYYQAHEDGREGRARTAQAGHCSKQSKEPRSRRHALAGNGRLRWTHRLDEKSTVLRWCDGLTGGGPEAAIHSGLDSAHPPVKPTFLERIYECRGALSPVPLFVTSTMRKRAFPAIIFA